MPTPLKNGDDPIPYVKLDFIWRVFKSQLSLIKVAGWYLDRVEELSTAALEGRVPTERECLTLQAAAREDRRWLQVAEAQCRQWIASFGAELELSRLSDRPHNVNVKAKNS